MKVTTPQIVWHSKEPVFCADFHRSGELWRLVTGGADKDVKVWKVVQEERKVKVVFMASLSRHTGAVNVVRFSPNGEVLASAGDDNVVCLWKLGEGGGAGSNVAMDTTQNKENWSVTKVLRGHLEDIYDACWSSNCSLLVTGSVDNTAIVWDTSKGQSLCILGESKQYVQGVAWDPIGQYLATLSNDRYLRIYSVEQKYKCIHTVGKMALPEQEKGAGSKHFRMWIDESLSFFFRRLTFSPDGSLLIVPAGRFENGDKVTNTTYIFTRNNFTKPTVCLPGPEKATVVVKFCPCLFELRDSIEKEKSLFSLPYRMVYAVASLDAVLLYDTQQTTPFAYLSNMHYSGITDLAWSDDGLVLVVTSSDAYCSIVTFEPGELGVALAMEKFPESRQQCKNGGEAVKKAGIVKTVENGGEDSESPNARITESHTKSTDEEQLARGADHKRKAETNSDQNRESPAGVCSEENTAAVGVKMDIKGKRRIRTTIVESFTSSSEKTQPPSPSLTSSSKASKSQPETEVRTSSLSENTATELFTSTCGNAENVANSSTTATQNSTQEKKARRIHFVTLSSVPLLSHDSDSKSHDQDSTHPTQSTVVNGKTDSDSDKVEPMEIQIE